MRKKQVCCNCGKVLVKDEVALTKKLIDPEAEEFFCLDCMAENIGCTIDDLKDKIVEFKEQGCTLFL